MMLTCKDLINMVRGKFSHHLTKEEKDYIRLNLDEKPDLPYNPVPRITGEIRDDKKFMSMMEDFWLPRREDVYPDW